MNINGTEIDFSKQRGYFFQMDCMDALKQMPDKSVSLAIVDPPYGAGFTEGGGCQGWFSKYHQDEITDKTKGTHFHGRGRSKRYQEAYNDESSQICQVERERERERDGEAVEQVRRTVRQVQDAEHTTHLESGSAARVTRTGGTWAEKYAKKSFRGTQPREKSIFKNFFVSHGIK